MGLRAWREVPDYQLCPGSPDVRGWWVRDRAGEVVGPVVELYLDDGDGGVRFLGLLLPEGREVLLPLEPLVLEPEAGELRDPLHARAEMDQWPGFTPSPGRTTHPGRTPPAKAGGMR